MTCPHNNEQGECATCWKESMNEEWRCLWCKKKYKGSADVAKYLHHIVTTHGVPDVFIERFFKEVREWYQSSVGKSK